MSNSQTRPWGSISFLAFLVVLKCLPNNGGSGVFGVAFFGDSDAFCSDMLSFLFGDLKTLRRVCEIFLKGPLVILRMMRGQIMRR